MIELERPLRAGKIALVPAADPVGDPARLRIELFDADGNALGNVSISAADIRDKSARAVALFAFQIEEEQRKIEHLQRYPLLAGSHNRARIEVELAEDFDDWFLRQRRGRDRYEGLAENDVREWQRHR